MKIEATRIKSWVERIERLIEERAGINGDIKDIYAEIKSGEHDAKAIRKLIQRRAADPAALAEQDALLSAYTDALAGKIKAAAAIAGGASVRQAAKAGGISTGAAAALVSVQKSRELNAPHDPETGEIPAAGVPAAPAVGDGGLKSCGIADGREANRASGVASYETPTPVGIEPGPQDIDLTIPAHLRRERVTA
jgi:uncharacterized protein (UPF0335 family)